jgi:hypothetical protein
MSLTLNCESNKFTFIRISSRLANVHLLYALIHDFELIERNLSAPGLIRVLVALGDHFDNVLQELPRIVNLAQLHLTAIEHMRGGEDGGNYFSADQVCWNNLTFLFLSVILFCRQSPVCGNH